MKSTLLLITTLLSVSAFSETATLTVDGMHCSGCKKMVAKAVCKDAKIAEITGNMRCHCRTRKSNKALLF
jgi:hypothetical protein